MTALADEPLAVRATWDGNVAYFVTGDAMAEDGPDADTTTVEVAVDASFAVTSADVPASGSLEAAVLYWGGNQQQFGAGVGCNVSGTSAPDTTVTLTTAGGGVHTVVNDACYCADGAAASYDMWACHADVTAELLADGGAMIGNWLVEDYVGDINNSATANASAALFLVYTDPALVPRRVVQYDGLLTLSSNSTASNLAGFTVDTGATGSLTYWSLEGDVGGAAPGAEFVRVDGNPGVGTLVLSDAINPSNNPMNHTINTTTPTQSGTIGVDIDEYDITSALTAFDTSLDVTFSANSDKWWIALNVVDDPRRLRPLPRRR